MQSDKLEEIMLTPPASPTPTKKPITKEELQTIKKDIGTICNFSSQEKGVESVETPDILLNTLKAGFTEFKEKTGRNMTYLEIREMMG
jgi:hypothetical protein